MSADRKSKHKKTKPAVLVGVLAHPDSASDICKLGLRPKMFSQSPIVSVYSTAISTASFKFWTFCTRPLRHLSVHAADRRSP